MPTDHALAIALLSGPRSTVSVRQQVIDRNAAGDLKCQHLIMAELRRRSGRTGPAVATLLAAVLLAGCAQTGVSSSPHRRYADTALGKARLMRDATPRIVGAVDVSHAVASLHHSTTGAAVLIDGRLGKQAGTRDLRRRPLLVQYVSASAARKAMAGKRSSGFVERGREVLYFPVNFPPVARKDYRRAMYVGLG